MLACVFGTTSTFLSRQIHYYDSFFLFFFVLLFFFFTFLLLILPIEAILRCYYFSRDEMSIMILIPIEKDLPPSIVSPLIS